MADAEQYRDWASQQVDRRTANAMYAEADRIDRRDRESRSSTLVQIIITVHNQGTNQ